MIKRLRVTVDGNTYDVTVETADDQPGLAPAPAASATPPPISAPPPIAPPPAVAPVAAPPPASPSGPAAPGDVPSPLAGRVTAIVVNAGHHVKEGDHLLTLEAMKMNTFVFAPKSGKVSGIQVAVGDAVEENQVLMHIA